MARFTDDWRPDSTSARRYNRKALSEVIKGELGLASHIRSHRLMMRSYPAFVLVAARARKSSSCAWELFGSVLTSASRRAISATVSGEGVAFGFDQVNHDRDRRMHGCVSGRLSLDDGNAEGECDFEYCRLDSKTVLPWYVDKQRSWRIGGGTAARPRARRAPENSKCNDMHLDDLTSARGW